MRYRRKWDGSLVDAVQWQPGVEHPAVMREYPADRGHRQGWAEARTADGSCCPITPGTWAVCPPTGPEADCTLVGAEAFADQYEFAPGENPPPTRTCWVARFAGVSDSPCGEDCAALLPGGCGILVAFGMIPIGGDQ